MAGHLARGGGRPSPVSTLWVAWAIWWLNALPSAGAEGSGPNTDLHSIKRPAMVLLTGEDTLPGAFGGNSLLTGWQQLDDWVAGQKMDLRVARLGASSGDPTIRCFAENEKVTTYEGPMDLARLKAFASQVCRGVNLDQSSRAPVDKYSADPSRHDTEFSKMVKEMTDRNYATLTKGHRSVVIVYSGMCALCKVLRPCYNRLKKESRLSSVAILSLDADKHKKNPAARTATGTPAVLFLHEGSVTARLDLKPSRDTTAYCIELLSWAVRQELMGSEEVATAAAALQISPEEERTSIGQQSIFFEAIPLLTEEVIGKHPGGLLVFYHSDACWQCDQLQALWSAVAGDGQLRVARYAASLASDSRDVWPLMCGSAFCAVYWRDGQPVASFKGTFEMGALQTFWQRLSGLTSGEAAAMASRLAVQGGAGRGGVRQARLASEASVVRGLHEKEAKGKGRSDRSEL